jgi:hypothetical protein
MSPGQGLAPVRQPVTAIIANIWIDFIATNDQTFAR